MKKLLGLAAAGAICLATPAAATNGMRMIGFGPVQNSMGGVGVAATLDGASVVSNPAGLVDLGERLDVGFSWFKPNVSYAASGSDFSGAGGPPGSFFVANSGNVDSDRGGSPIPSIAYVRPVGENLSVGLGVFGVAGMGVNYKSNLYQSKSLTSYLQGRLAPGFAYRASDWFAFGATANVMVGQMEYDVAHAFGQAEHETATAWGIGMTAGLKVTPVKMLTLAAAWESKSNFQDFEFKVPARDNPFAPGETIPGGTDKLHFDQPQVFTLGASVQPLESVLVAVDAEWIEWSRTMGAGLPQYATDPNATGAMPFNMGWKDQWVYKIGAQVTPMKGLDLRVGYNYGKMPLSKDRAFENLVFPAVAEHHITAGVGYAFSGKLNGNLGFMFSPESKISGSNPNPPQVGGQGIAAYSTKMSQWEIDGGVAWKF